MKGLAPFPCADTLWAAWRHRHSALSLLPAMVAVRVILPPLWNSVLLVHLWDISYCTTQLQHIHSAERYPPYHAFDYKIRYFWLDNGHVCIGINSKLWKIWGCAVVKMKIIFFDVIPCHLAEIYRLWRSILPPSSGCASWRWRQYIHVISNNNKLTYNGHPQLTRP